MLITQFTKSIDIFFQDTYNSFIYFTDILNLEFAFPRDFSMEGDI